MRWFTWFVPDDDVRRSAPAPPPTPAVALRLSSNLLLVVGAVLIGIWLFWQAYAGLYQHFEERAFEQGRRARLAAESAEPIRPPSAPPKVGDVIGTIHVEQMGLKAIVVEGDDDANLRVAVGHVPGTALPGGAGNTALAGHRDSFFRGLGKLKPKDVVTVTTMDGEFRYEIEWTRIVMPDDVWVLKGDRDPKLTLVTCYPFHYVGSAPKRYIVRARLLP